MKKFFIILILLVLSGGEISNSSIVVNEKRRKERYELYLQIQKEKEIRNMIEIIELKAEIKIPDYVDVQYIEYMYELAHEFEIPIRTAFRLIYNESRFVDTIVSPKGAYGFMQLMPRTFEGYKDVLNFQCAEITNNRGNIYIGFYLLRELHDYWSSRVKSNEYAWTLALASYNAGKGNVIDHKGIPPFNETINYVNFIMEKHSNPEFHTNYLASYENPNKNGS